LPLSLALDAILLNFFLLRLEAPRRLPAWNLALAYLPAPAILALGLPERAQMPYWAFATAAAALACIRARSRRERGQALALLGGFLAYAAAQGAEQLAPGDMPLNAPAYPMIPFLAALYYATLRFRFLAPRPALPGEDIVEHMGDPVFFLDGSLTVNLANRAAGKLLDSRPESLRSALFSSLLRSGAEAERKLLAFARGAEPTLRLQLAFARGADTVTAEASLSRVQDEFSDLAGILVIARERRERKDFQERFRVTGREMEIVDLVLAGSSNRAIGDSLGISERTVEAHCLHVYNKLGTRNKAELVRLCAEYALLA
jgi:DNA-binding CsgD family transcriptional regulator